MDLHQANDTELVAPDLAVTEHEAVLDLYPEPTEAELEALAVALDDEPADLASSIVPAVVQSSFDYSGMSSKFAREVRASADRIRDHHRKSILNILEIGKELNAVKAKLPHGKFSDWLVAELGMSVRSGENYMRAAQEFGDKAEIASTLPATALYKLAAKSTPAAVRQAVINEVSAGNTPTLDEIRKRVIVSGKPRKKPAAETGASAVGTTGKTTHNKPPETNKAEQAKGQSGDPSFAIDLARAIQKKFRPDSFSRFRKYLEKAGGLEFLEAVCALDTDAKAGEPVEEASTVE